MLEDRWKLLGVVRTLSPDLNRESESMITGGGTSLEITVKTVITKR